MSRKEHNTPYFNNYSYIDEPQGKDPGTQLPHFTSSPVRNSSSNFDPSDYKRIVNFYSLSQLAEASNNRGSLLTKYPYSSSRLMYNITGLLQNWTLPKSKGSDFDLDIKPPSAASFSYTDTELLKILAVFDDNNRKTVISISSVLESRGIFGLQDTIKIEGDILDYIAPIVGLSIKQIGPKIHLYVCSAHHGTFILNISNCASQEGTYVLESEDIVRRIPDELLVCRRSPDGLFLAGLSGVYNTLRLYSCLDERTQRTVSTFPEVADELAWSNDSSVIACFAAKCASRVFFIDPSSGTSQSIKLPISKERIVVRAGSKG